MTTKKLVRIKTVSDKRIQTGIEAFDSFLGGGFVEGQTVFIAGQPGVGKSTLLLQLSAILATESKILYVSGEESLGQVKARAIRLQTLPEEVYCSDGIELEQIILSSDKLDSKFIIVDSLQMVTSKEVKGEPGSSKQMKHCLLSLIAYAKEKNRILIVIGHSTKSGLLAGLLTLQHMVDTVLFMAKDEFDSRSIIAKKNRFGGVDDEFDLKMTEGGFLEFEDRLEELRLPTEEKVKGNPLHIRVSRDIIEQHVSRTIFALLTGFLHLIQKRTLGEVIANDYEIVFKRTS